MLKPLRDQVIIKRNKPNDRTESGLYIANPVVENVLDGEVVAVGSGHLLDNGTVLPLEVSVGNKVFFSKGYSEIKHEGETYLVLRESAIFAVIP